MPIQTCRVTGLSVITTPSSASLVVTIPSLARAAVGLGLPELPLPGRRGERTNLPGGLKRILPQNCRLFFGRALHPGQDRPRTRSCAHHGPSALLPGMLVRSRSRARQGGGGEQQAGGGYGEPPHPLAQRDTGEPQPRRAEPRARQRPLGIPSAGMASARQGCKSGWRVACWRIFSFLNLPLVCCRPPSSL